MKLHRSIISIAFALIVIFSGSKFTLGVHLCGGEIQNVSLFGKAAGCDKKKKLPPCHHDEVAPCCQDETIMHLAQDFKSDFVDLVLSPLPITSVVQPTVFISYIIPVVEHSRKSYFNYDPPLRSTDFNISFSVFLI